MSLKSSAGLFLFTRFPQPGHTKTRLIPALGATNAAELQKQMTMHLFSHFQSFCKQANIQLQVHFAGGSLQQMQHWLGNKTRLIPQCEGNLGDRIIFSLQQGFQSHLQRIIIVGSDCPQLNHTHITQTLNALNTNDVVFGPATDGGYYLVGINQLQRDLFENVPWSTEQLLEETLAIADRQKLSVALLESLSDIDRPEDLSLWEAVRPKCQT